MKNNLKMVIGLVFGILITFTLDVAAETLISSEGVSYSNSKTSETTVSGALDELFSAIEISRQIGDITKISAIGDGTIADAISTLNTNVESINSSVSQLNSDLTTVTSKLSGISTGANKLNLTRKTGSISCNYKALYDTGSVSNIISLTAHTSSGEVVPCSVQDGRYLRFYTGHLGDSTYTVNYSYYVYSIT